MLQTYKAILRGDRLEWRDGVPDVLPADQPVAVHVTILDDSVPVSGGLSSGQHLVAVLEQLAQIRALEDITDPASWERDIRVDRPLPDRGD